MIRRVAPLIDLAWRDLRGSGGALWVLCACLVLGVTLIAATGGLYRQVSGALLADTRALFGGDVEVRDRAPLGPDELAWMRARGEVSLLVELRTMLLTEEGRARLVELQSFDARYPLYGEVVLEPSASLPEVLAKRDGTWGVSFDPRLAQRLGVGVGDRVDVGALTVEVRAITVRQPDRGLRADWRGPPVLIAEAALAETGLIGPGSRLAYRYRVKTDRGVDEWREAFATAFPDSEGELRTFEHQSAHIAEALAQLGSTLLLIGFSALFVGGLGVFNSVHAYLQSKLETIATLGAIGMRDAGLARVYVSQVLVLAGGASLAGAVAGSALALFGAGIVAERLPIAPEIAELAAPAAVAWLFGVLVALTFAMPAIGRALSIEPAALFRGIDAAATRTPARWWWLAAAGAALTAGLVLATLPDALFGLAFVVVVLALLALLEVVVRGLRAIALDLSDRRALAGRFALRLALAGMHRRGSGLRPMLLSLGSALTLLVASTLVSAALLRTLDDTIPARSPALVLYDIASTQADAVREEIEAAPSLARLDVAPLVLGRLAEVNGVRLRDSADPRVVLEARDEHKLSYRKNNFDSVVVERGAWWADDYRGPPLVAMEDREADQLGLRVGDRLRFEILGETVDADLAAIYGQRRFEARFWLEGIFSDGALDPFITRYVGAAWLDPDEAAAAQDRIAAVAPNVVTVHTQGILEEARALLSKASAALAIVAATSLLASLLVLASVVATSRARQIFDATILLTLGARVRMIRAALRLEYAVVAILVSAFAVALGSAIAWALLEYRLELDTGPIWWLAAPTALAVSVASLGLGARWLLARLSLSPAALLRAEG